MEGLVGDQGDDGQGEEGQDERDQGRDPPRPEHPHGLPKPAAWSSAWPAGERTAATNALAAAWFLSPLTSSAAGWLGLAAAYTSAGAPCSICVSSAPEPPNV